MAKESPPESFSQTKYIPISCIDSIDAMNSFPKGFMYEGKYRLISGGAIVEQLREAGEDFVEIEEIQLPECYVSGCSASGLMSLFDTWGREAFTAYQPTMISGVHAPMPRETADTRLNAITKELAQLQFPFEGMSLLEIGSAQGYMALSFDSYGFTVDAIDGDPKRVSISRWVNKLSKGSVNFDFNKALPFLDSFNEETPYLDKQYDVVVMLNVLHWLRRQNNWEGTTEVQKVVARLASIAKKAVVLAFPVSAVMDVDTNEEAPDILLDWGEQQFESVKFLCHGASYPVWLCKMKNEG